MYDPWEVAAFRLAQIAPLLDEGLTEDERQRILRKKCKTPVEWPQSERDRKKGKPPKEKPVGRSTLYRWRERFLAKGYAGLMPTGRRDRGERRSDRAAWVSYAIGLLVEEPDRALSQLLGYLWLEFPDFDLSRSTLSRDLNAHPAYKWVRKQRKGGGKLRDRYEAREVHDSWQLDGKGPFPVRLKDGRTVRVVVLSILDDKSRAILATIVAGSENTEAAVRVFRMAVEKYGLPKRVQFDRGSAFESKVFRDGIAILGDHRNRVKVRNAPAQGKIEAFHRILGRWFVRELRYQEVVDLVHLEQLLQATIDVLYNQRHRHRELKMTPAEALGGRPSPRRVGTEDLLRVFRMKAMATPDRKTGEVRLPNGRFRVPAPYAGKKRAFRYDPIEPQAFLLVGRQEIPLETFEVKEPFAWEEKERRGVGQLQKIVDDWTGKKRPNAQPGFGLPEVFRELGRLLGRLVPKDEQEAAAIHGFYAEVGPLPAAPFRKAIEKTQRALGEGRALAHYLDHLRRLCRADRPDQKEN